MDSEDKVIATTVIAFAFAIVVLVLCVTHYNVSIEREAIKAGLEQQQVGNTTLWVKPTSKPTN